MGKIAAAIIRIKLEELAKKLVEGYTDKAIMQELNLPRSTFYYRKAQVFRIYGNIAEKKIEEMLEAEAHILKDRFLRLYRHLEQNITNGNDRLSDKAQAAQVAAELGIKILQLEVEGFKARRLKQAEAKAAKYV